MKYTPILLALVFALSFVVFSFGALAQPNLSDNGKYICTGPQGAECSSSCVMYGNYCLYDYDGSRGEKIRGYFGTSIGCYFDTYEDKNKIKPYTKKTNYGGVDPRCVDFTCRNDGWHTNYDNYRLTSCGVNKYCWNGDCTYINQVIFCEGSKYTSNCLLTRSEYPKLSSNEDNKYSSLYVPEGCSVTIYEKSNYQGKSLTLTGPQKIDNLKNLKKNCVKHNCWFLNIGCDCDWNNVISSFKVNCGGTTTTTTVTTTTTTIHCLSHGATSHTDYSTCCTGLELREDLWSNEKSKLYTCCYPSECSQDGICVSSGKVYAYWNKKCDNGKWVNITTTTTTIKPTTTTIKTTTTTIKPTTTTIKTTTTTIPSSCHSGSPGSWSYCSDTCKCNAGEGDCDYTGTDRQCVAGTVCVKDVGAKYGWLPSIDVCEYPNQTTNEICNDGMDNDGDGTIDCKDTDCCKSSYCQPIGCKCPDLNNDGIINLFDLNILSQHWSSVTSLYDLTGDNFVDCRDLNCVSKNFGKNASQVAECQSTTTTTIPSSCHSGSPGSWSYCSDTCKCNAGEGDCDYTGTDRQCVAGTVCVKDVGAKYGWLPSIDVCEAVSTGSMIADASDFIANSWRSLFG